MTMHPRVSNTASFENLVSHNQPFSPFCLICSIYLLHIHSSIEYKFSGSTKHILLTFGEIT